MSKINKKLLQILETAQRLLWKHGIRKITIEEVCYEAGVSKMTFYKHFKNKNELVKVIITRFFDSSIKKMRDMIESHRTFPEKVSAMLSLKSEATDKMSKEFLDDFYHINDPELVKFMNEKKMQNIGAVMNFFTEAQKNGDIRKDIKPEFILYILNTMVEMGEDESLLAMYDSAHNMAMEVTNFFFYGILPRGEYGNKS
jgi:AcrR family transcriptional regulator